MKALFCPNCRRKIDPPKMLKNINIQGDVKINCGHCKKGVVKIKGKKQEEVMQE